MRQTPVNILQRMNKKRLFIIVAALIFVLGILSKTYYVHYTETWQRQHDVISFGADEGHAAYIEYILNNKQLPDFDPREKWAFFQPPLHHIVSATVLGLSRNLGFKEKTCQENTQIPTCFYMIFVMCAAMYIYRKVYKEKGTYSSGSGVSTYIRMGKTDWMGAISVAAVVGLHPIFTIMSGSINNDGLALFLSVVSILMAAAWYSNPTWIRTVLLAVFIGLSMFAKLTGGLTAVAIGILMAYRALGFSITGDSTYAMSAFDGKKADIADRVRFAVRNYLSKFVLFAIIVFPIGLYWSIRNKIKWNMPFNYIPGVGENFPEEITMMDRLINVKTPSVYPMMVGNGDAYDEYNTFLLMVKSSLFGEYNYSELGRLVRYASVLLFILAIVLIVVGLIATFVVTFSKKSELTIKWKILLFGTWLTYLLAYLYFVLSSSNFSAGDFRYSAICIMIEGIYIGLFVDKLSNKVIKYSITCVSIMFAAMSFVIYAMLGIRG